jgi:hypothetical protein
MSAAQRKYAKQPTKAQPKLQAPWFVHLRVWIFMITLGISPFLYILATRDRIESAEWLEALVAVVLIQGALWIAQRRCASEDLSYWEGLLVAGAAMTTGIGPISLMLSFPVLLLTVAASVLFALIHDADRPRRNAPIRFGKLIIGIHKQRLY